MDTRLHYNTAKDHLTHKHRDALSGRCYTIKYLLVPNPLRYHYRCYAEPLTGIANACLDLFSVIFHVTLDQI